jgi:hypothetical protein
VDPSQIVTVSHTVASLKTIVSNMTKKTTHLEAEYDKMKRNYDNVAMLKKQTPGGTSRLSKQRRGKNAVNEESAAEGEDLECGSCSSVRQKRQCTSRIHRLTLRGLVVGSRPLI